MKIKTSELTGAALDRAVMLADGFTYQVGMPTSEWAADNACEASIWRRSPGGTWACMRCSSDGYPSTDWSQGGPIIERESISVCPASDAPWMACDSQGKNRHTGPTPLIAAMRCFVASKLGNEVDIPDELIKTA